MNREPAAVVGSITAAVSAIIALFVAFGLDLTDEQVAAILAVVAVVAPIVSGLITRGKVTPVVSTQPPEDRNYL